MTHVSIRSVMKSYWFVNVNLHWWPQRNMYRTATQYDQNTASYPSIGCLKTYVIDSRCSNNAQWPKLKNVLLVAVAVVFLKCMIFTMHNTALLPGYLQCEINADLTQRRITFYISNSDNIPHNKRTSNDLHCSDFNLVIYTGSKTNPTHLPFGQDGGDVVNEYI